MAAALRESGALLNLIYLNSRAWFCLYGAELALMTSDVLVASWDSKGRSMVMIALGVVSVVVLVLGRLYLRAASCRHVVHM